jgi:transcriptional regulator of heat shock response
MVTTPMLRNKQIKFIQLSQVDEEKLVAVIVVGDNIAKNKIIKVSRPLINEEVLKFNILLNTFLQGVSVDHINLELMQTMKKQAGDYADILERIFEGIVDVVKEAEEMTTKQSGIIENYQRDNSALSSRIQRDQQEITKLKAETTNNSDYIGKINQQRSALEADNEQLKDRVRELESGRDHVLDELQAKIAELESRPVEVAVQDNSEELEQLRKEYEAKLKEAEADLAEAVEDGRYREINAMIRIARENVNTICMRIKGLSPGKAKETIVKYAMEIGLLLKQLN